jgi:hypothetical protein
MLGGANKSIIVVATKNEEAITVEMMSSITLEGFCTIHATVICQLILVEALLKAAIRLRNESSNVGLLRDFEGFIYEMNDIEHV